MPIYWWARCNGAVRKCNGKFSGHSLHVTHFWQTTAEACTWQARHGQLAEQLYLFIQTPCRANLPFNSNTTRQARHGQLAEQFYLFIQTPLDSCRRGINILGGAGMVSVDHTSTLDLAKNLRPGNSRFARLATHWCKRLDTWPAHACPGDEFASVLWMEGWTIDR